MPQYSLTNTNTLRVQKSNTLEGEHETPKKNMTYGLEKWLGSGLDPSTHMAVQTVCNSGGANAFSGLYRH